MARATLEEGIIQQTLESEAAPFITLFCLTHLYTGLCSSCLLSMI